MNSLSRPLGLFLLLLMAANVSAADQFWHTDLNKARKIAQESDRILLLHFGAVWCGPCQKMEKDVFPNPKIVQQLRSNVVGVKIDVNKHPNLAKRFSITNFPTDVFLEPDGTQILQSVGFRDVNQYVSTMMRAQTRYAELVASRQSKPSTDSQALASKQPQTMTTAEQKPMLGGYCPVTLWKTRRWIKGSTQLSATYKDQVYHFASTEAYDDFQLSPETYVPQFLGCDPVIVWETDRAVSGDTRYGAFYDERLYLFISDENRKRFKSSPDQFIKTQVVLQTDQIERVIR